MIDLHTHTLHSDGELLPAELARRAEAIGYTALGFSDHVDDSNLANVVPCLVKAARSLVPHLCLAIVPAVELTHVPPARIGVLTERARELGAAYVVVHGETLVEPVAPGTNRAAIEAGVDVLAHPGLITEEEARLAAEKGVRLEISTRKGHSLSNGHVARLAKKVGALLVVNTDSHAPSDLASPAFARAVVRGAGLTDADFEEMQRTASALISRWRP